MLMAQKTLYGVNLCGWLVLESWVTPSLFASTGAFDEAGLREAIGAGRYETVVRTHRETFITEKDFLKIASRGFNAVRIPVPWYVFGDDGPMGGDLSGCISYLDRALDWAEAADISVLLDLALVPGSTMSPDGHRTLMDPLGTFRDAIIEVVAGLAMRYAERSAFLGIEPLEEPVVQRRKGLTLTPGIPMHTLRNFYRDCYEAVREVAGRRPVLVISAAGEPGEWRRFMAQDRYDNVWLDIHPYHYSDQVDAAGPAGARKLVARSDEMIRKAKTSGLPVVVGEWSAALPATSTVTTPEGRIALERVYTAAQLQAFRSCAGWFFQTWKTESKLSAWDARIALSSFEKGMFD
jgi:glucan 1,3-beta-glucosidase